MESNREIPVSAIEEWLIHRELQKMQERKLAEMWRQEFKENDNTKLWLKLRDGEK